MILLLDRRQDVKFIFLLQKKGNLMSTIPPPKNPETNPRVKAVFDDIRATRGSEFINNLWYYLAFDTELLEATWRDVKKVMTKPSHLDLSQKN